MFLDDKLRDDLRKRLAPLTKKVKLIFFTQELECSYCRETKQLLQELSETSEFIHLEVKNFITDKEDVEKYGVDKIPAIVLLDENGTDYGIKLYGIPSGYEFSTLLEDILLLGTGEHGFSDNIVEQVKNIASPVHLQVFVTPTCPYCPQAVVTAHKFSYLNKNIKGDMVEATEFPHLSNKYNVRGVPRTIINENDFVEGAVPEYMVLEKILSNLQKEPVS
ncbi:MAG: glutaredoxin [Ignavibacteriales bacterium]|nr:MAG: glutaredoxin [Ignavibacteriales bacterium]